MPRLLVTFLDDIGQAIAETQPSHLLTLLGPDYMIDPHPAFGTRHLRLTMSDIAQPADGLIAPSRGHVDQVLAFADGWDRASPMLIHCWAGISRSTASAFMILCKLNPHAEESAILSRMRSVAPHVAPNRLLVALADEKLQRDGRMVEALDAAGPAELASRGRRFELPVSF